MDGETNDRVQSINSGCPHHSMIYFCTRLTTFISSLRAATLTFTLLISNSVKNLTGSIVVLLCCVIVSCYTVNWLADLYLIEVNLKTAFKARLCCFLLNVKFMFNENQWLVIDITPAHVVKSINTYLSEG